MVKSSAVSILSGQYVENIPKLQSSCSDDGAPKRRLLVYSPRLDDFQLHGLDGSLS